MYPRSFTYYIILNAIQGDDISFDKDVRQGMSQWSSYPFVKYLTYTSIVFAKRIFLSESKFTLHNQHSVKISQSHCVYDQVFPIYKTYSIIFQ